MSSYVNNERLMSHDGHMERDVTTAVWLSGGFMTVEGDETTEMKVPVKIEKYPSEVIIIIFPG